MVYDSKDSLGSAARGTERVNGEQTSLRELALLFLRLGATAFGGPAAHIAMMEDEVVRRRQWLSADRFLDLLGATQLIPGPNSTELAIHIGWERRRWSGLLVAGLSFIVPAMLITAALAWAYVRFGTLPQAAWLLYGVKPVVVAIIVQALWTLAPKTARTWPLRGLGLVVAIALAFQVNEIALLFGAGFAVVLATSRHGRGSGEEGFSQVAPLVPVAAGAAAAVSMTLPAIFLLFVKIGSVLFGSGYVLLAFLHADLVERLHWITDAQLTDAIAVGQMTPGPVFTTATFIGYLLAGANGAVVATAGIFLPAFVFVALSAPLIPRLRASPSTAAFLDGVNVASIALMAIVTVRLGRAAIVDVFTAALCIVGVLLLVRFKWNSSWLVLAGALAGFAAHIEL
jgi:chromate transporter